MPIVPLVLSVIGLILLRPLLRLAIAFVDGRGIGKRALAKQPDRIQLREAGPAAWQDREAADRLTQPLIMLGYEQAGTFTVAEMPGVVVRLLVHLRECVAAMVYEHPKVGLWVELTTRYTGGTACSVTSGRDRGLAQWPGHPVTHLPGAAPDVLHARLLAQRPANGMLPLEAGKAAAAFEAGFAEGMAWRKAQGISRAEVVKIAVKGVPRQKAA